MTFNAKSQDPQESYYFEIPEYPESYTAGTVAGRMVDGLGFRYFWATEGLTESDLNYKPSAEARTLLETIDHLYGLSMTIVNAPQSLPNEGLNKASEMRFEEKREKTLANLQKASELLKNPNGDPMDSYKVIFKRGDRQSEFPFWNIINGPIADALWHTGQVVLMRRASGNPITSKVSFFSGKLRQ